MSQHVSAAGQASLSKIRRRAPRQTTPALSVVIVNYRQWDNTAALVRQVRGAPCARRGQVEVVVVDNHSPFHPLAARLRRWSGVSLRRWGNNRGFARAVNEGARLGLGPWILLLNPDISLPPDFLPGVIDLIQRVPLENPTVGIVGFALKNSDGTPQPSAGPFPTFFKTLAGLFRPRSHRKCRDLDCRQFLPVDWVTGCCLLVRRECFQDLGGLDENFFLYYEDVDLCRRARDRGWTVWHEPALHAVHHNPLHDRRVSPSLRLVTRHSLLTYSARHWPAWQFRLLTAIVRIEAQARRLWAWWRGQDTRIFQDLDALAADLARGRQQSARLRLKKFVRKQEKAGGFL